MKIFLDLFDFTLSFKFYSNIVLYALGLVSSSLFSTTTTAGDTITKHITPALFDIFIWNNPPNACVPNHIYLCDIFLFESAFKLWNGKFFYHPHFIICDNVTFNVTNHAETYNTNMRRHTCTDRYTHRYNLNAIRDNWGLWP